MFKCIVDDEVELRLLASQHAPVLNSLIDANRSYLRKWLPWLDANREEKDTRRFIDWTRKKFAENKEIVAGIWYQQKLVGVVSLQNINIPGATFMGYWISEEYQGRGLVTRAVRALVDYAFRDLDLHRVEIRCALGNIGSQGIPSRLGFRKEGILKEAELLYDHYEDSVIYGILKTEWLETENGI